MKTINISIDDLHALLDELRELEQRSAELSSENDYLHGFVTYKKLNAEFNHFREKETTYTMMEGASWYGSNMSGAYRIL